MADGVIQLSKWSAGTIARDRYTAPEAGVLRLSGFVAGHPKKRDGKLVITSPVAAADGRRITTASGSVYELVGEPDPSFLAFLKSIGRTYDADAPIVVTGVSRV